VLPNSEVDAIAELHGLGTGRLLRRLVDEFFRDVRED